MRHDKGAHEPKPAATIMLLRDDPEFQVLMVRRHQQVDFASGALVFPGGKLHRGDSNPAWVEHCAGWDQFDVVQRSLRIAAIREVFEEAGILMARYPGSDLFEAASDPDVRASVERGEIAFIDVVRELGVLLRLDALSIFARWITPLIMPKRFDTFFYVVHAPANQVAACDGHETVDAEWISPSDVLRLAKCGERTVIFPTRMNVQLLAEANDAADCIKRAEERTLVTVIPALEERDGKRLLVIPDNAGYGSVVEVVG